ncbi:MAG: hypothetical protein QOI06_1384 [Nocardioidaceae bacterium]|nr:hypothetical protein [Nocardioidaceae bacterium]
MLAVASLGPMDSAAWDERYRDDDLVWGSEPNRFVREQCERLPVGKALDLACGEGRNALWLARLGWYVTGVDFSQAAIGRARELTTNLPSLDALRLTWQVRDVTTLDLKADSIDLALASYVQLAPKDRHEMLTRAAAALRTGGHLVIVAHDKRNLAEGVSGPQDPDLLYDPEDMRSLLGDAYGLVIELARTVERETPDGVALDTVLRARRD